MAEDFALDLVEGELLIRDAEEPYALTNPTAISGVNDTETGAISGGSFTTPQVNLRQDITSPLPATVFIDADFSMVTPGSVAGTIDSLGNMTVQASLTVDLHIDVQPPGGGTTFIEADCTASPVHLTLKGVYGDGQVTLVDENFSVPEVTVEPACSDLISGEVDDQLAGPGHALSMTLAGSLTPPPPPGCPTATTLGAAPAGEAVLGASVDLTAMVSIPDPDHDLCLAAAADGATTEGGLVDFFDGNALVGTAAVQADGTATMTTSHLPAGTRDLSAQFKPFTPFRASTTAATLAYRITPNPAITATLPDYLQIGAADPTEFTVTVTNTGFGRPIDHGRLDITLTKPSSVIGGDLGAHRVALERLDATDTWVPVPLTSQNPPGLQNAVLWGQVGDATGFSLPIGEEITHRMRIRIPLTGQPIEDCGAPTGETCPLPVDVALELVEVDATGTPAAVAAPAPDAIAASTGRLSLVEGTRRASTITMGAGVPSVPSTVIAPLTPHTVRQGATVSLNSIRVGPSLPTGQGATGHLTFRLDGQALPVRNQYTGFDPVDRVTVSGTVTALFDVPVDASLGTHTVTVRYSGDEWFLPTQATMTFTVIESTAGALFDCLFTGIDQYRFRTFVEGSARLPTVLPVGSEIDLGSGIAQFSLRMLFARERPGQFFARNQIVLNNATLPVGTDDLVIGLGFGPGGTGSGASLTRTNGTVIPTAGASAPPNPLTPANIAAGMADDVIVINQPNGTVTLDGAPGESVPVTIDRILLQTTEANGFPNPMLCTPVDQGLVLGEVTASGATLTANPGGPVRAGDDVTLTATVAPYTTGQVEFRDGDESIGVVPVIDGVATMTTDDLPMGTRSLSAIYTGGLLAPALVTNTVELTVLPALECKTFAAEGNGAVVRLVYIELLGRCPDQAGYTYWKSRLDNGTSPEAFARAIARTPEAVGRVVDDAYQTMLGRAPDAAGRAFWTRRLQASGRYDQLLADLAASGEFWSKAGGSNVGFVTRVYEQLLGRSPDTAGLDHWTGKLATGTSRRALVLTLANLNEPLGVLVTQSYDEILDRAPDGTERTTGITHLRATGDRSGLYAELIGLPEFSTRAQQLPNAAD